MPNFFSVLTASPGVTQYDVSRDQHHQQGALDAHLRLDRLIFDMSSPPAGGTFTGTVDPTGATNSRAAITSRFAYAAANGYAAVWFTAGTYLISDAEDTTNGYGIVVPPGLSVYGAGSNKTTFVIGGSTAFNLFMIKSTLSTTAVATITSDWAARATSFTASAGLNGIAPGDLVFSRMGQNPTDPAEARDTRFMTVASGSSGTTLNVDTPVAWSGTVSSISAVNKRFTKVTAVAERMSIGGFHVVGSGNTSFRHAVGTLAARFIQYHDITGIDVGSGLIEARSTDSSSARDLYVYRCASQSSAIKGRGVTLYNSTSFGIDNLNTDYMDAQSVYVDSFSKGVSVRGLRVQNRSSSRSQNSLVFVGVGCTVQITAMGVDNLGTDVPVDFGTAAGTLRGSCDITNSDIYSLEPRILEVDDYGADPTGATNSNAAFLAVLSRAKAQRATITGATDPRGNVTIIVGPGTYLLTDIGAMLGVEAMTAKGSGITFRGYGKDVTKIRFAPTSGGALCSNNWWQNITFESMSFYASTTGSTLFYSDTTATTTAAQGFVWRDCSFYGWKYIVSLQGSNNNSEGWFYGCRNYSMENPGAWLYAPAGGSDQFLNFWWFGGSHWTTSAPLIDSTFGGSYYLSGMDCSNWGTALTSTGYLFKLNGFTHAQGVCNLRVDTLRVEAKNANAALLYSEWPQGNISMNSVDWSSQVGTYTYGQIITLVLQNTNGAVVTVRDSTLAGQVGISYSTNVWQREAKIVFEDCAWLQQTSPSDVVVYDASGASPNGPNQPPVIFRDCRSATANNAFGTTGAAVWNATIGYRGQLVQSLQKRALSVRAVNGVPNSTVPKVQLPIGAIITGLTVLAPPNSSVTEADGGSWTLATTDTTPVTVVTATVATALKDGFSVTASPTVPFYCGTAAQATLTITPTNVAQLNQLALLLIEGYW